MPFNSYPSAAEVARSHRIRIRIEEFVNPVPLPHDEHLRVDLEFTLRDSLYRISAAAVCESLIYPILRRVWRTYVTDLTLWSHYPLTFDGDLCGIPDYMISRRSPLGFPVPDQPFLLIVEAKRDDFERGWGQCLAAMRAAQKLSGSPELTFFGASTNGVTWQFGRLDADEFIQDSRPFSIQDLDGLVAALNQVMLCCRKQAARLPAGV